MTVTSTDLENGLRLIQISGHSATQSFSRKFLPQIAQAIDAGLIHPNVRAIILTGEGKFFSAGAILMISRNLLMKEMLQN